MSFRKHGFSTFDTSDLQFLRVSRKLWPQYLNHRTIFPSNSPTWSSMSGIFIACGCYDKLPQTLWLETPHIHLLSSCGDQKSRMGFSSQQRGIGSAPLALMALGQVLFFFCLFKLEGGGRLLPSLAQALSSILKVGSVPSSPNLSLSLILLLSSHVP